MAAGTSRGARRLDDRRGLPLEEVAEQAAQLRPWPRLARSGTRGALRLAEALRQRPPGARCRVGSRRAPCGSCEMHRPSRPSVAPLIAAPRPCARPTAPGRCVPAVRARSRCRVQPPRERQPAERARAAPERAEQRHADARQRVIEARPPGQRGPDLQTQPVEQRACRPAANSASRQCRIRPGSGIFIGHTCLAAPAEGRGVGQVRRPLRRRSVPASAPRRSGPDRPSRRHGRRSAVIDRAMVHAGAAADAAQHLLELACRAAPSGRCRG